MKKLFVLFVIIIALTVNTFAYTPSFLIDGESVTTDNVFKVRITAEIKEKKEEDTDFPGTADSNTAFTDEVTEMSTYVGEVTTVTEDTTVPEDTTTFEDITAYLTDTVSHGEMTDTDIPSDASTETDSGTDTDGGENTHKYDMFGGEGTVVFDTSKVQIVSALPCVPDGVTVVYAGTDGAFRFMFYSENAIVDDIPLLDLQFRIISGYGSVSVTLSEGIFSNGDADTPCEDISFTAVYEASETSPVTTVRPADSATSAVTTAYEESEHQTENRTESTQRPDLPTEGDAKTEPTEPTEPDGTSLLPVIIVVTAAVVIAAVTAVIFIVKKTKK